MEVKKCLGHMPGFARIVIALYLPNTPVLVVFVGKNYLWKVISKNCRFVRQTFRKVTVMIAKRQKPKNAISAAALTKWNADRNLATDVYVKPIVWPGPKSFPESAAIKTTEKAPEFYRGFSFWKFYYYF